MRFITKAGSVFLIFLFSAFSVFAADVTYDRYAPVFKKNPTSPSALKDIAPHLLAAPLEIVRWPLDKGLILTEKYHLDKKTLWLYDKIQDQGITPHLNSISFTNPGAGVDVDFIRLFRQKEQLPDGILNGWVDYAGGIYFETGGKVGVEHIAGTGFRAYELLKYENRPEEHFYGLGPHSSKGDGSVYEMEATTLESTAGYAMNPTLNFDGKFAFRDINISGGHDGGRGQIREHPSFSAERVPGIAGERIITVGAEIHRDTRNHKEDSTRGGDQRVAMSFNEGLGASGARYLKYAAETSQYFSLKSERRVLVLHFYGEHNNELDHKYVPFHQMAKLGDYGTAPYLSHTLRAFTDNRFFDESALLFNVEYRYTIWEYKEMKVNSVLFWDEGQVFNDFGDFKPKDFRESYGLGFRFSVANNVLLSLEAAHGDEGTRYYVKSTAPF